MQARATSRMYFWVEVVRKLFTDKPLKHYVRRKIEKKKKKERENVVWNFPVLEEGYGNLQLKNGKASATQPKRQPSQGRQLLLLNTKRPENRGSRQIFCPTQPLRAKFFRHVSELWTWSMDCSSFFPFLSLYEPVSNSYAYAWRFFFFFFFFLSKVRK